MFESDSECGGKKTRFLICGADSSIAWNTGSSSPGELLMTPRTSEVAVCCSSASASFFFRSALAREGGQREFSPSLSSNEDR